MNKLLNKRFLFLIFILFLISCSDTIDKSNLGKLGSGCKPNNTCNDELICKDNKCIEGCMPSMCSDLSVECGRTDDGCGNILDCGGCSDGKLCNTNLGKCVDNCTANCDYKECGDDGCAGSCGECGSDKICSEFKCVVDCTPSTCSDLGIECGAIDDGCGNILDCGGCSDGKLCNTNLGKCVDNCTANCDDKECGDDGCAGSCGECGGDKTCSDFKCVTNCTPSTCFDLGIECGAIDDGCGIVLDCGGCSNGETCDTGLGKCVDNCTANCDDKECGDDGCGGSCGGCGENEACDESSGSCTCSQGYRLKNGNCVDNTVISGITTPNTTAPIVMISPSDFLKYAYSIVFNREYDISGFNYWKRQLELGVITESEIYEIFLGTDEVGNSAILKDKREMIKRAYQLVFKRIPDDSEIDYWAGRIKNYDGTGSGFTWYEFYHILIESEEYYNTNCDKEYYSYGKGLNNRTPLLQDLFTGNASFQSINDSTTVNISVQDNAGYNMMWDIGLSIIYDKETNTYYAYNRVYNESTQKFNIITSTSTDGINFTQYGGLIFENSQNVLTLYDPHVVPDHLTCPKRYTMTFECNNIDGVGGANLCMSYTTTPNRLETWSYPKNVIKGYNMNGENKSASTGVSLATTQNRYLSWTVVDDSSTGQEEGDESTYVRGMEIDNYYDLSEYSTTGTVLLSSEANINCVGEECNNKDQTDWILEDGMYYLLYNGANYYRCVRPGHENLNDGSSDWRIKIRRSQSAISSYSDVADTIMYAERTDICGISYGKINEFNGELYLYVSYYPLSGGNKIIRSKLVWK